MARVFLSLGSNLGDRLFYLQSAVDALADLVQCSRLYETAPVDAPDGSASFLNAVVEIEYEARASELIKLVMGLEGAAGRIRAEINGPRTLDVDVVYVEGFISHAPEMIVPHPRAQYRAFVIAPLADIDMQIASELSPEIALSVKKAKASLLDEVYPGVVAVGGPLC